MKIFTWAFIAGTMGCVLSAPEAVAQEAKRFTVRTTAASYGNNDYSTGKSVLEDHPSAENDSASKVAASPQRNIPTAGYNVVGGGGACDAVDRGCCESNCGPLWTFRGGAMFLDRSDPESATIFTRPPGTEVLNASDLEFDTEAGFELSATRYLNPCWDLELRYMQIDGWRANNLLDLPPGAFGTIGTNPPTFLGAVNGMTIDSSYRSELHSTEATLWRRWNDWLRVGTGFRYVEFSERFHSDIENPISEAAVDFSTRNHLYGAQLATDALLLQRGLMTVELLGKAGIYGTHAKTSASMHQPLDTVLGSTRDTESTVSFVGELTPTTTVRLTDRLTLRSGYQLLWLEGLALAGNQISNTGLAATTSTADTDGGVFAHGATVSLEFTR